MVTVAAHKIGTRLRGDRKHLGVMLTNKAQAVFVLFTDNDALRRVQHNAKQGADARRSRADDQHGVLCGNFRNTRCPVPCRQHVPHQQRLPVGDIVRDFVQPGVGKRNADIFRLPAVDPAAQRPAAVFVGTVVDKALFAEKTFPAKGFHIDCHAIPRLNMGHGAADGFHNADHLMSDGDARHRARHTAVLDMQIAGADACQRHLDDGVPLVL